MSLRFTVSVKSKMASKKAGKAMGNIPMPACRVRTPKRGLHIAGPAAAKATSVPVTAVECSHPKYLGAHLMMAG